MIQVIKRDGEIAEFNLSKITEAIRKAFKATKKVYSDEILELLALRVTADFQSKMRDGQITVEEIQAPSTFSRRRATPMWPRLTFYIESSARGSAT